MLSLLQALWPLFALIVAGHLLRRRMLREAAFWAGAERLNYFVLFPALLFASLAAAPLDNPALADMAGSVLLALGLGWGALLAWHRWRGCSTARFGALTQGILRFNTYLGLAAVGSLFGSEGLALAALMLALMVPTVNVLSVWALARERGPNLRTLLLPIVRNPLILACLAGALYNLSGLGLGGGVDRLLQLLGAASLPLGLLCVGAALELGQLRGETRTLAGNSAMRLLGMPLLAYTVARLTGLPSLETSVLVLFFALPTAPTAYVLTRQLGGDSQLMAGLISVQTLLAAVSLPVVLALVAR